MTNIPILEGYGCKLRPVEVEDASFIVNLRNQPFAKGTIHAISTSVEKQIEWINAWKKREHDYYWIIEAADLPKTRIGTVGLYDLEFELKEGMPGRWVMFPQSIVSIIAPVMLVYAFAFDSLDLNRLIIDVVASNKKVRRFHELYGARYIDPPARYGDTEKEVGVPLVWFELTKEQWPNIRDYWNEVLEDY